MGTMVMIWIDNQNNDYYDGDDNNDDDLPHKYNFQHLHVRGQAPPKRSRCSVGLRKLWWQLGEDGDDD